MGSGKILPEIPQNLLRKRCIEIIQPFSRYTEDVQQFLRTKYNLNDEQMKFATFLNQTPDHERGKEIFEFAEYLLFSDHVIKRRNWINSKNVTLDSDTRKTLFTVYTIYLYQKTSYEMQKIEELQTQIHSDNQECFKHVNLDDFRHRTYFMIAEALLDYVIILTIFPSCFSDSDSDTNIQKISERFKELEYDREKIIADSIGVTDNLRNWLFDLQVYPICRFCLKHKV